MPHGFWVLLGVLFILAGLVLFETVIGLALIPVGLAIMAIGGGK